MPRVFRLKFIYKPNDLLKNGFDTPSMDEFLTKDEIKKHLQNCINQEMVFHAFQIGVETKMESRIKFDRTFPTSKEEEAIRESNTRWFSKECYVGEMASSKEVNMYNKEYEMGFGNYVKTFDGMMIPCARNVIAFNKNLEQIYPRPQNTK